MMLLIPHATSFPFTFSVGVVVRAHVALSAAVVAFIFVSWLPFASADNTFSSRYDGDWIEYILLSFKENGGVFVCPIPKRAYADNSIDVDNPCWSTSLVMLSYARNAHSCARDYVGDLLCQFSGSGYRQKWVPFLGDVNAPIAIKYTPHEMIFEAIRHIAIVTEVMKPLGQPYGANSNGYNFRPYLDGVAGFDGGPELHYVVAIDGGKTEGYASRMRAPVGIHEPEPISLLLGINYVEKRLINADYSRSGHGAL